MGKNLNIVHDWLKGNNLRPTSINFVTDKSELEKKKNDMLIGQKYSDDDGKEWEKTTYGWTSVPKVLSAIKESNPHCTVCQKEIDFHNKQDSRAYSHTKMCFDCMIDMDTTRKLQGSFKNFEQIYVFKKQRDFVKSTLQDLNEALLALEKQSAIEFINEFGDREKWSGLSPEKIKQDVMRDITEGEQVLLDINDQLSKLDAK